MLPCRLFLILLASLAAPPLRPASAAPTALADPTAAFARGNLAFESGDFAAAETAYRSLVAAGLASPELYYNLGNTAYRQDRAGEAALWYRRALAIDPRFAEARQNLRVVKKMTGCHDFELTGIDAWLARVSGGELTALLSAGAWLAALALAAAAVIRRLRPWRPMLIATALAGVILAAAALWGLGRQRTALDAGDLAIVTANEATAFTGPVPDAEKVVDLPPGSELQIIQRAGPWTYVAIPRDLRGWVRSDQIGKVAEVR